MIHLFFLHLPTQKRCWSFFISLGRKAREGLDSIFQGEHARCIPHILLLSLLSASLSARTRPRLRSATTSLEKTHIRATLSFLARLHSHKTALSFLSYAQLGTRSREFPIFSVAPFASGCTRISKRYLQQIFHVTYSGCFRLTTYNFN